MFAFIQREIVRGIFDLVLIIPIILAASSCGYTGKDGLEIDIQVVGKVRIQKQLNDSMVNLIYAKSDIVNRGLVENCEAIYYDSALNRIFVKASINKWNKKFYDISVDTSMHAVNDAISKRVTSEADFNRNGRQAVGKRWNFDKK